jgi:uroporphyrinogen decarboxylase
MTTPWNEEKSMMTPRDRVQIAIRRETPDRCPMQVSFTPEFAVRLREDLNLWSDSRHNPHGGGNPYDLERAVGCDMLITSIGWANSYYQADQDYVDEWGIGWRFAPYETRFGTGRYTEIAVHPLADDEAVAGYKSPDPRRPELYQAAERALREFGRDYWIAGATVTTIFETAWALRGLERMLMDFVLAPELAETILDFPFRYHLAAAKRLTEMGIDMLWIGDDVGGQTGMVISPATWRRFLKPRLAEFIATVKAINPRLVVAYHSDGTVYAIIPELIDIGIDVLNPVQPLCMDPALLKKKYGRNLSFWGSIDEQKTLPFGTPDDVRSEVLERLRTIGRGGGLIIGPTHNVQLDTPMENFWSMVRTITGTPYSDVG